MFEKRFTYDIEVFPKYFLFVAKEWDKDEWTIIQNDRAKMLAFWREHLGDDYLWIGYNNHNYDDKVIRWYLDGQNAYEASNSIIRGSEWQLPYEVSRAFHYHSYDAFTRVVDRAMSHGVSLKTLEAYMGVPIEEEHVPFDYDGELTSDEIATLVHYCKADVANTERVVKLQNELTGDLDGRIGMCELVGNPDLINLSKARAAIRILQGD